MCHSSWSLFLFDSAPGVCLGVFFSFFGGGFVYFWGLFSFFEGLKVLTSSASSAVSPAALTPCAQA